MGAKVDLSQLISDVETAGLFAKDLVDVYGVSAYLANRAVSESAGFAVPPGASVEVPVAARGAGNDVVAVVATGAAVGAVTFDCGLFLRDRELAQPVRRVATHLATDRATDRGQVLTDLREIDAHAIIADGTVKPSFADPAAQLVVDQAWSGLGAQFFADHWTRPADVFVLGRALPIALRLGFAGRGGVPGTRHYRLPDILAAEVLKGTPTL